MESFMNEYPEVVNAILVIGGSLILFAFLFCVLMLPSIRRYRKSRSKEVECLPAYLVKIIYETGVSNCRVYFLVDGEKKRRSFDARRTFVAHMPEIGTKGTLTCKGHILYSFEWDDKKVVQDDPAYGKTGYADMI